MSEYRVRVFDAKDRENLGWTRAGEGEAICDEEGGLLAAYIVSISEQSATLEYFLLNDETLSDLVVRRLLQEARFRGASRVDVSAFLETNKAFRLAGSNVHGAIEVVRDLRAPYTPKYCEENAILMFNELTNARLVLVSSAAKCTSFRFQRATLSPEDPVFWDYHAFVYDLNEDVIVDADCTLAWRLDRQTYLNATFADAPWLASKYQPHFRLFDREQIVHLKSDRSHMNEGGEWLSPPPSWQRLNDESTLMTAITPEFQEGTLIDLPTFLSDDLASRIDSK